MDEKHVHRLHRRGLLAGGILLGAAAVGLPLLQTGERLPDPPVVDITSQRTRPAAPGRGVLVAAEKTQRPSPADDPRESSLAARLVGRWRMEKHGSRTLHLKEDGSATVDARLDLLASLVYAERLTLELTWTLEGEVMSQSISGGTPDPAVQRLIRDWGDHRDYRVVEVDEDRMVLSEVGDDEDLDVWTRVRAQQTTSSDETKQQSPR